MNTAYLSFHCVCSQWNRFHIHFWMLFLFFYSLHCLCCHAACKERRIVMFVCLTVCLVVCLSVREHISETTRLIFINFSHLWPWLGPRLAALRCAMYFRFMGDAIFEHNGREQSTQIGHVLNTTQQEPAWYGFDSATNTQTYPRGTAPDRGELWYLRYEMLF